jgi:hypothetical protein
VDSKRSTYVCTLILSLGLSNIAILSLESVKALFSHFTLKSLPAIAALQKIYLIKWNLNKTQVGLFSCNKSLEAIEVLEFFL